MQYNLKGRYDRIQARKLDAVLQSAHLALIHSVPNDCFSTGPLTGDPIEDLVVCPGCRAIAAIEEVLTEAQADVYSIKEVQS